MASSAGLKAGLIGAAAVVLLTLLGRLPLPFLSCACCLGVLLAFAGAGALAGHLMSPPRAAGGGAGAGAMAGAISGVASGLVNGVMAVIGGNGVGDYTAFLDPEMVQRLTDAGIDPQSFVNVSGAGGVIIGVSLCCVTMVVLGAMLGAMGGALYSSVNSE